MVRNMVTSLLEHGRIETTDAKAKEVRRVAERMITLGKRGTLHARRRALRVIRSRDVAARVFGDLAERYRDRPGGYTRVLKLRQRIGDAAPISLLELVESTERPTKEGAKATRKAVARKKGAEKAAKPRKAEASGKEAAGGRRAAESGGRKARPAAKGKARGDTTVRKSAAPRKSGRSSKSD